MFDQCGGAKNTYGSGDSQETKDQKSVRPSDIYSVLSLPNKKYMHKHNAKRKGGEKDTKKHAQGSSECQKWRRGRDSNPRYPDGYNTLAGCRFQPLSHLSKKDRHIIRDLIVFRNSYFGCRGLKVGVSGSGGRFDRRLPCVLP